MPGEPGGRETYRQHRAGRCRAGIVGFRRAGARGAHRRGQLGDRGRQRVVVSLRARQGEKRRHSRVRDGGQADVALIGRGRGRGRCRRNEHIAADADRDAVGEEPEVGDRRDGGGGARRVRRDGWHVYGLQVGRRRA